MPRKKKSSSSPPSPLKNEEIGTNLKAKNSDENLSTPQENTETMRKRSLVSLPTEDGEEDEFLFIRLRKQIKGHWDKIMENGIIFRPRHHESTSNNTQNNHPSEITRIDSVRTESSVATTSTTSTIGLVEQSLLSSTIKSVLLLPAFSCKRDDEDRRVVPFISSLLRVNAKEHVFILIILGLS